ncbi:MAG: WD40 repeat domain-containing protein [Sphingomicrobium sp.]
MHKSWIPVLALVLAAGCDSQPRTSSNGPALTARLARTWLLGDGPGRQALFSRDGALLAMADANGDVVVRRTSDWKLASRIHHPGGATALAFASNNNLLSGGYDGVVRSWDLRSSGQLTQYAGAHGTLWTVDVSSDGRHVAAAGEDGIIRIWPIDSNAAPTLLKGHARNVWEVEFSPDGNQLASGSFDKSARIWDVRTGKLLRTLNGHEQAVVGLDLSRDGRRLVTGGDDSTIRLWRTTDGAPLKRVKAGNHIYSMDLSKDGRWLATGGRARGAVGTFWHQLTGAGGNARPAKLWRISDMAMVAALPHEDDVVSVTFSPDGRWLVTSSEDHKARLWRLTAVPR